MKHLIEGEGGAAERQSRRRLVQALAVDGMPREVKSICPKYCGGGMKLAWAAGVPIIMKKGGRAVPAA